MGLIVYDIYVLIDPTQCYIFNCNDATVEVSTSTDTYYVSGWPLTVSWPAYFSRNMYVKRVAQATQLLTAALFIIFATLYIVTFVIYRNIRLDEKYVFNQFRTIVLAEERKIPTRKKTINSISPGSLQNSFLNPPTKFLSDDQMYVPMRLDNITPDTSITTLNPESHKRDIRPKTRRKTMYSFDLPANYRLLCSRCKIKPRKLLSNVYEWTNFLPYLCVECNQAYIDMRREFDNESKRHHYLWRP